MANITSFNENRNASFYMGAVHAHSKLFVGPDPVQQVFLGGVPQPYGTTWFYTPAGGGYTQITTTPFHAVTVSFVPANGTLSNCTLVSAVNGSVISGQASVQTTLSWFCNPSTLNVIANYLFQTGVPVAVNSTNVTVTKNVFNHLHPLHTPQSAVNAAYYTITYLNDTSGHVYAVQSNTIILANLTNLPITFWELKYGATHQFNGTTNGLITLVRTNLSPLNYTVIVKNSTGTVMINQSYSNISLIDQQNYNVSNSSKPASLFIYAPEHSSSLIYSAYLGSPISLASVASFFHQYFSYQGFDLLNFLPIVFAAMFTRNTVGIGAVMVVVLIATLSWLSVIPIPDTYIFIMIVIAILGLIGYRMSGYSS